ncbi:MAG: hypothetical protein J7623_25700 [Chitinophaga sp.]|uniref:DUF6933 domain-containing protein n=1 Tax=Chitinophaga sp. TaxID=1869181 RepID=UPI001B0EE4E4|nr:hypothetical protein [Chitinophaga sp.]MBO9732062.1 hypothetical protein [Chitinophaga sp.]
MPVIFHAVQKLLNTSRIQAVKYVSEPALGQQLHSWYAKLLSTGFPGKLLVMYVHEPSLLAVICRGKTVAGTWNEFQRRLPVLLQKVGFKEEQIRSEMSQMESYVVAKTNSRSMISYMNQMAPNLEWHDYPSYNDIILDEMEERMLLYLYDAHTKPQSYTSSLEYWHKALNQE